MHKRPLEGHSAPTGLDKPTALVAFKSLSFCGSRFSSSPALIAGLDKPTAEAKKCTRGLWRDIVRPRDLISLQL